MQYTNELKKRIRQLCDYGLSGRKIAKELGLSKSGVNYTLANAGYEGYSSWKKSKKTTKPLVNTTRSGSKILVIPDVQAKHGHDFSFLNKLGQYIVEKQPDKIICLGDFADMPSLSSYDVGKKTFEGRRYRLDVAAAREAMLSLLEPLWNYNCINPEYNPEMIMLYGNHEHRINRAVNDDPKLDGVLSLEDLGYEEFGWKTVPFLDVIVVDGIAFSHYFTTGLAGRPAATASAQLAKKHMSCIAGHQQGLQIATAYRADGQPLTSLICGSFYEHNEDYMSSQGNKHWRGVLMLHEVKDGAFDLMPVSLGYLNKKYK
jgi:hypothetical protein